MGRGARRRWRLTGAPWRRAAPRRLTVSSIARIDSLRWTGRVCFGTSTGGVIHVRPMNPGRLRSGSWFLMLEVTVSQDRRRQTRSPFAAEVSTGARRDRLLQRGDPFPQPRPYCVAARGCLSVLRKTRRNGAALSLPDTASSFSTGASRLDASGPRRILKRSPTGPTPFLAKLREANSGKSSSKELPLEFIAGGF